MNTISNEFVKLSLDANANLTELINLKSGHNYAGQQNFWRLIYEQGMVKEIAVDGADCRQPKCYCTGNEIIIEYDSITTTTSRLNVKLKFKFRLKKEQIVIDAFVDNQSDDLTIRELHVAVRNMNMLKNQRLIWTFRSGEQYRNIRKKLEETTTYYCAADHKAHEMSVLYPDRATTNCYVLDTPEQGLYVGSHDNSFQTTLHLLRLRGNAFDASLAKYPFLKPGEKKSFPNFVFAPYSGSWHQASHIYRNWADTWYTPVNDIPDHIKNMNGWQRIIMRHQYGEIMFRHDQMPKILNDGMAAGIDTLFMFGWHREGHDAGYPEYNFDETQGGREQLKKYIKEFRDSGGKILLYFNGRLIDMETDFYKEKGERLSIKNANGTLHQERYMFGGDGTALRQFGNKNFTAACLGTDEWYEHLKKLCDIALDLEVDGIFFDQLGFCPPQCWDDSHGHPVPFLNTMEVYADVLRRLRKYVRSRNPLFSFGTEWFIDVVATQVDYIHNITGGCKVANDWESTGEKPVMEQFPEWGRYTFPEIIVSDREIRDDTDIERRVNLCLLRGFRSDVEIYRCRATIAETPHYQAYMKQANRLRDKYPDLLLNGTMRDTDGFTIDNPEVFSSAFTTGNRMAVLVTQSHLNSTNCHLNISGYKFDEYDGLGDISVSGDNESADITIGRHGLAVVIYSKSE